MKRKIKKWWVNNSTNINKTNDNPLFSFTEHKKVYEMLEIQVLAWDKHKYVVR